MTNIIMVSALSLGLVIFSFGKLGTVKPGFSIAKATNSALHESVTFVFELIEKEMVSEIALTKQNYFNLTRTLKYVPGIQLNASQARVYQKASPTRANELKNILNNSRLREQFKYVMNRAQALNLPKELALIPVIESQYNPKAVSPVGAGGPWQLMPGTAKDLGISNQQRFQLEPSTGAALAYFKDLYKEYGNWELAIAAYNAGDGRVNGALKKNPGAATVQDLKLPLETRNYVQAFFQLQNELKSYDI